MNKFLAVDSVRLAADQDHSETQFRYNHMIDNSDGIPLKENQGTFMISPNGAILSKSTKIWIEIPIGISAFSDRTIKSISIPASVELLHEECFSCQDLERVTISADC
jgi:hypothetical protein